RPLPHVAAFCRPIRSGRLPCRSGAGALVRPDVSAGLPLRRRAGRIPAPPRTPPVSRDALGDLLFYGMLGVIVGGRIWYMLFYYEGGIGWIWREPLVLFKVWDGGMSFHGGLL